MHGSRTVLWCKPDQHTIWLVLQLLSEELNSINKFFAYKQAVPQDKKPAVKENPLLQMASVIALTHHEKCDGSGYPNCKSNLPNFAQLIGIIDCYEALTNDDRPYRSAMDPLKALEIIKKDVIKNKFDVKQFEQFAYSLT